MMRAGRWLTLMTAAYAIAIALNARVAAESFFIPAANRADMVHDAVRNIVYITSGSEVLRFSLATRAFLPPFRVGGRLLGIDISPDNNLLAVADDTYIRPSTGTFSPLQFWFHLIDLRTGLSEKVVLPTSFYSFAEGGTYSVAFGSDGCVYSTTRFLGSGWGYLRRYDPRTRRAEFVPTDIVRQDTMLTTTPDRSVIAFAESNISDGRWGALRLTDGYILRRQWYEQGTASFNRDIAIDRSATRVAILATGGLFTFDGPALTRVQRFRSAYPVQVVGAAYHPTRDLLFVAVSGAADIRVFDTTSFVEVARYSTPPLAPVLYSAYENGRMKMSRDGRLLFAALPGGVGYVSITNVIEETDAAVSYGGRWDSLPCAACSGGALRFSTEPLARATFTFTGSSVRWIAANAPLAGKANLYVDGVFRTTIDLYAASVNLQVPYEVSGLAHDRHTVTIEVAALSHPNASGIAVAVDAFEIMP